MKVTESGVPVDELIDDIKQAIKVANLSAGTSRDVQVTGIELTLNVVATASAGGGLDFRVPFIDMHLKIGRKVTRQDTHTIEVELAPLGTEEYEVRAGEVQRVLVDAVETIRAIIRGAERGENPFRLDTARVRLSFLVTREGSISLGLEGELTEEVTHSLTVTIGPVA